MKGEVFGPILPVFTYKDIDEAIKIIKQGDKPLSVYYFGANTSRNKNLQKVRQETSSGQFCVNEIAMQFMSPKLPFGGVGQSGYGRCHGYQGFLELSNQKSIFTKYQIKMWPFSVIWPPYTKSKQRTVHFMLKYLSANQSTIAKRLVILIILLWILWLVVTKRITWKKVKNAQNILKVALSMTFKM